MLQLAQLCQLVTCALAVYVGVRTLIIWSRTRKIPELAIGINVLAIAIGGLLFTVLWATRGPDDSRAPSALLTVATLAIFVHIVATYVGNWVIYRRGSRWAVALVVAGTLASAAWAITSAANLGESRERMLLCLGVRDVAMCWGAIEAFRYSAMLRRRVQLGLAEPAIAHRIWLWGVGATTQVGLVSLEIGSLVLNDLRFDQSPWGLYLTAGVGLIGTTAIALAFFPPTVYLDAIVGRSSGPDRSEAS